MLKSKIVGILFFLLFSFICNAQQRELTGYIKDSLNTPLNGVTVIAEFEKSQTKFAISDINGSFAISFPSTTDSIQLTLRSLGFETQNSQLIFNNNSNITKTYFLVHTVEALEEIIIESKRKIAVDKDTITYNLDFFKDNTESSVEDLLSKLPGIAVDEDGNVSYNGQNIEKILVDGDNLTDRDYQILSKNLDADLLKNVQVLRNYDDNPLRKNFIDSDKVAINLTIKENKKNIIFGVAKLGGSIEKKYNVNTNLGLLNKNLKWINLNGLNNNGYTTNSQQKIITNIDDIDAQVKPIIIDEVISGAGINTGFLKDNEAVRNTTFSNTLTGVKNFSKKLSGRFVAMANTDKIKINKNSVNTVMVDPPITYSQNAENTNHLSNLKSNIAFTYFNNKRLYGTFESSLQIDRKKWQERISTNNNNINNNSQTYNTYFFNHLRMSYQLNEKIFLENYGYLTFSNHKQKYFLTPSLIIGSDSLNQITKNNQLHLGYKGRLTYKLPNGSLQYQLSLGNEEQFYETKLNPSIDSLNTEQHYNALDFNNSIKYTYQINATNNLNTEIGVVLKKVSNITNEIQNLPKFKLGYNFKVNNRNKLGISYQFKKDLLNRSNLYDGYLLSSHRSLVKSNNALIKTNINSIGLSHNYQKIEKEFLMTTLVSLSYFDKSLIANSIINQENNVYNYESVDKSRYFLFTQHRITKYFHPILTSFKLENKFDIFSQFVSINNNDFIKLNNYNYHLKLSGTTYFNIPINFQFHTDYQNFKSTYDTVNSSSENYIFGLNSIAILSKEIRNKFTLNYYNIGGDKQTFINNNFFYKPEKSNFQYTFTIHNLLNNKSLKTTSINDYNYYYSNTEIISRYVMFTLTYRF